MCSEVGFFHLREGGRERRAEEGEGDRESERAMEIEKEGNRERRRATGGSTETERRGGRGSLAGLSEGRAQPSTSLP